MATVTCFKCGDCGYVSGLALVTGKPPSCPVCNQDLGKANAKTTALAKVKYVNETLVKGLQNAELHGYTKPHDIAISIKAALDNAGLAIQFSGTKKLKDLRNGIFNTPNLK